MTPSIIYPISHIIYIFLDTLYKGMKRLFKTVWQSSQKLESGTNFGAIDPAAPTPQEIAQTPTTRGLYVAIQLRSIRLTRRLIEAGANVNACDGTLGTPLAQAMIVLQSYEIVKLLLEYGADPNLHDSGTLLCYSLACHDRALTRVLLENGADPNRLCGGGLTPFLRSFRWYTGCAWAHEMLLEHGADPNVPDRNGDTPLILAVKKNCVNLVTLLVRHKAIQVDLPNIETGETPLFVASKMRLYEIVRSLIWHGADVNVMTTNGSTPLHVALEGRKWSRYFYRQTIALLVDKGANVNAKNAQGVTPLMLATEVEDVATIKVLLEHHADTELRDTPGRTALDWARIHKSLAVTYVLVRRDPPSALRDLLQVAISCSSLTLK